MNPVDPHITGVTFMLQLLAWAFQAWVVLVAASIATLSLILLRRRAEQNSARSVMVLRAVIRLLGGGILLSGVQRNFPEMHASLFGDGTRPSSGDGSGWARYKPWAVAIGLLLVMLLFSGAANAQAPAPLNAGLFDEIGNFYAVQAKAMAAILRPMALTLFGSLSLISFALFLYRQALSGDGNMQALIAKFAFEILKVGFFLWLVQKAPEFVMQFLGYFIDAGEKAGQTGPLSASTIVSLGFDSCFRIFDAIGEMGWGDTAAFGLPLALAGLLILACFAIVGVLFLIRMVELHLIVYGGILLLGFGGLSFTRDIPKNYLSYVISAGTQLFMLSVIIGLGMQLAGSWPATLTTGGDGQNIMHQALYVLVSAATFASLAWSIPKVAASMVSGSISMGAADVMAPAAAAGGAGAGGGAGGTGGARAVVGGVGKAATGAIQAQSAGVALASEQGASGLSAGIKGLGHAAGSMAKETGAAAKSKMGLRPPSPNAVDARGRSVPTMGARVANDLQGKKQALREGKAAGPAAEGTASKAPGAAAGDAQPKAGEESVAKGQAAGSTSTKPDAGELRIGGSTGDLHSATGQQRPNSPTPAPEKRDSDRRPALRPPQLPPDTTPNSAVSIRLDVIE